MTTSSQESIKAEDLSVYGDWLLVRKCINDDIRDGDDIILYLPEVLADETNWCEIVAIGQCRVFTEDHIGCYLKAPEFSNALTRCDFPGLDPDDRELWFVRESGLEVKWVLDVK